MLLEGDDGGESRMVLLRPNSIVYVPGHTAHRTINIGDEPLAYLGVYPARAGHDYGVLAERNFRSVVVNRDGRPSPLHSFAGARVGVGSPSPARPLPSSQRWLAARGRSSTPGPF
jgi:glucose-6-phosphate isomerase